MKCFRDCYDIRCVHEATHYVHIVFSGDERWEFDTTYVDDYVCQGHISNYIASCDEGGVTIIEIAVKQLKGSQ